jgi:hypothetical protein
LWAWHIFRAAGKISGASAVAYSMVGVGNPLCWGPPGFIATPFLVNIAFCTCMWLQLCYIVFTIYVDKYYSGKYVRYLLRYFFRRDGKVKHCAIVNLSNRAVLINNVACFKVKGSSTRNNIRHACDTTFKNRSSSSIEIQAISIVKELARRWQDLDATVPEGIEELKTHCTIELRIQGYPKRNCVPQPRILVETSLEKAKVALPAALPH